MYINLLSLKMPELKNVSFRVYSEQDALNRRVALGPQLTGDRKQLTWYTAFEETDGSSAETLAVDFSSQPGILQRYYLFHLEKYARELQMLTRRSDFGALEVWVPQKSRPEDFTQPVRFFGFSLRIVRSQPDGKYRLRVGYLREMRLLQQPLSSMTKHKHKIREVVFRQQLLKLKSAEKWLPADASELFPVVSPALTGLPGLRLTAPARQRTYGRKHALVLVKGFVKKYLRSPAFRQAFPYLDQRNKSAFARVQTSDLIHLNDTVHALETGRGAITTHADLNAVLQQKGPYLGIRKPVLHYLIVHAVHDEGACKKLRFFIENQLSTFMKQSFRCEGTLAFQMDKALVPQLKEGLQALYRRGIKPDLVWYVSPWGPHEEDPVRRVIYHQFKQFMTGQQLPSQVIRSASVNGSMPYYSCNLGIKLWFKLHGIPWLAAEREKDQLVMGLNMYRAKGAGQGWTAGVLCMSEAENILRIGAERADHPEDLVQVVAHALQRMREELLKSSTRAIVVHYYKPLNRHEAAQIRKLLDAFCRQTGKEVLIYIAGISDATYGEHLIWREQPGEPGDKPLISGLNPAEAVRVGDDVWLLCTHTRKNYKTRASQPNLLRVQLEKVQGGAAADAASRQRIDEPESIGILAQILRFTLLNWKSVLPGRIPLTLRLTGYMARHHAQLPGGGGFSNRYAANGIVNL
ncbi:hypothetical protein CYPRO_2472 [Cyclonatronum proteinivorum]|uniref:Piwi domain-containing protein n=2 Tax=Cyclonatronum proteinivorum TaxID=1457365 RepID=A0A345UML2_9BACT|nr:hypothetical protein CYPRO_2472 [Cyclonatronum proteinivorum]